MSKDKETYSRKPQTAKKFVNLSKVAGSRGSEQLPKSWTMWYNKNIPKKVKRKGGIFMPRGKPNKRYTPEFKIRVVETMQREKLS